ncbi:hypothetical protein [Devriesea agamarum]|uniref:hypothetical protein n=1 Tax=Devriesea agamarum TaxID=472569 RepID=UPI00071D8C68|nr:hypothetical protein [Devriesea agamarum]
MTRIFDSVSGRWQATQPYMHDGKSWEKAMSDGEDSAVQFRSMFDPYIGKGTVLQRSVADMPLDPDSAKYAQYMWDWSPFRPNGAWGSRTSLNTSAYGTQPIHAYVVDSRDPACTFQQLNGVSIQTDQIEIDTYMRGSIPLPSWGVAAQNGDHGLAIYDRGTGIMRELFFAMKDKDGVWVASGGYSVAEPDFKNLATTNYGLQQRRGLSNVAGMHNSLGFIGISEVLNGKIDHALTFTAAALRMLNKDGTTRISWPARGADGKLEHYMSGGRKWNESDPNRYTGDGVTPTHGQWGRLPISVDPLNDPRTGQPYRPLTQILIRAAQTYGLVATDTNLWCHAFNAEQGRTYAHIYGADPWAFDGLIDKKYRRPGEGRGQGLNISDFPWDLTEWAPIDWGRPSPDMNIRPDEYRPWVRKP